MSRRSPFVGWVLVVTAVAGMASGCVDRRFVFESDPTNANVYVNNKLIGATPVDMQFTYYGKYRITFDHDGYQRLVVDEEIGMPWYEYFPFEFIAENLLPFVVRDVHIIRKPLEPVHVIPPEAIRDRANELRLQGQSIGVPQAPATTPPG
jgi:hypothetical protein